MKWNQSRPGFELVSPCSFPTAITITPQASPSLPVLLTILWILFQEHYHYVWLSGRVLLLLLSLFFYSWWIFYINVSQWTFTRVTASFLRSPGLFSVFWPFSTKLWFPFFQRFQFSFHFFGDLPSVPATIGIAVPCIFNCFFSSLARSKYFSIFLLSFIFTKSTNYFYCYLSLFFIVNYH